MDRITEIIRADAASIIKRVSLEPLRGKNIVVTGATGLIGTYVLACLEAFGGCGVVLRMSKNEPHPSHPAAHFCKKWIYCTTDLSTPHHYNLDLGISADYVFYAAGYGQPAKFINPPTATIGLNTFGLTKALNGLDEGGRLLYVSSSEIYSGHTKPPYCEHEVGTTNPQHPRGCYIEAKRCGEALCMAHNTEHPRNRAVAARVALAYGPGTQKDDDRAVNQFIRQAILDRKIKLKDSGQVIRNYCYIADTVTYLLHIWLYGVQDVYNVAGKSKVTIAALARKISEITGVDIEIPVHSDLSSAPDNVTLDTRLVEGEFGKLDYVPLEEGLRRTIDWQRILYGQV